MNVRTATAADVPRVLPMVAKICAFHEKIDPAKYGFRPNPAERYGGWLPKRVDDPQSVFLVADPTSAGESPRLAGFLIGTVEAEIPIYRVTRFGFVHDLWVDEEYRHEGVARQMVSLAIERFKDIGVEQVRLDVVAHNDPATALFTACGFRPSVTEMLIELGKPRKNSPPR